MTTEKYFKSWKIPEAKSGKTEISQLKKTKQNNHKQTQKNIFLFLYVNKGLYNS